nr:immunoglobulin light chain junction region [Macaca mulatta]
CQQYNSAPPTF